MTDAYAYTDDIWLPLASAVFLAAIGLYTWRRCDVPARKPFVAASLFGSLLLLGIAFEAAAIAPATKIAWYKWQFAMEMLAVTAGTCFTLEYTFPGRWLTRRNLALLALPPLLGVILLIVDERLIWLQLEVGPDGSVFGHIRHRGYDPAGLYMVPGPDQCGRISVALCTTRRSIAGPWC